MQRAMAAAICLIAILGTYDVARSVTIRCVRPADRYRVIALGDLDQLSKPLAEIAIHAPIHGRTGQALKIHVTMARREGANIGPIFAYLDHGRPFPVTLQGDALDVTLPSEAISQGAHALTFRLITADLTGYSEAMGDTEIVVTP